MVTQNFKITRFSCYFSYLARSAVFALPPLLFMTFREMYGISYTLLGTLVLANFCAQLGIDLVFSFFTKYFNIKKTLRTVPLLTSLGLLIYAFAPVLFKGHVYMGLLIGTIIFSASAGLTEVLISPIIAAIPSAHPDKDMSMLYSLHAWGIVSVVIISTLFFNIFGSQKWMYITVFFALLQIGVCLLLCASPVPELSSGQGKGSVKTTKRTVGLMLCVGCIFLCGATETIMTNWISGYLENALHISKTYGDIFGMSLFALLLGLGRTLYAKFGRNITAILFCSMLGAAICYITAAVCSNSFIALFACVATGFCVAMLWPGSLIMMEENMPDPGVAAYALMVAGGSLGSSIAAQLMGVVVDVVSSGSMAARLSQTLLISPEQIGMKTGMLITAVFPVLGMILLMCIKKYFSNSNKKVYDK